MFERLLTDHYRRYPAASINLDAAVVSVPYNDANLTYVGRWVDEVGGRWSGWGGSYVSFKIRGTGFLRVLYTVTDTRSDASTVSALVVDGVTASTNTLTTVSETGTVNVAKTYAIPNDGLDHTIQVFGYGLGSFQFSTAIKMVVTGFEVGSGAVITAWSGGSTVLHCLGDSWIVADASWVKMLNGPTYTVYPISNTGYQVSTANTNYTLDYTAVTNTSDPTPAKVLMSFGVNDFNASVTVNNFQTSLIALIDKVRIRYPSVPIVLVRVPNNTTTGDAYGQYGTAMSNATGLRTNVTYINTSSIDSSMTWMPDNSHLNPAGQAALSAFVQPLL